jgi:hypothetical protein
LEQLLVLFDLLIMSVAHGLEQHRAGIYCRRLVLVTGIVIDSSMQQVLHQPRPQTCGAWMFGNHATVRLQHCQVILLDSLGL